MSLFSRKKTESKILIVGTKRYCINMCDFDLAFRKSSHDIVKVLFHQSTSKRRWWKSKKNCPGNRNGIHTILTENPHEPWSKHHDLIKKIEKTDFDYLCLGNGNDETGLFLQKNLKVNYLYSEYGWLPWKECFYIDDKGTGPLSSIRNIDLNEGFQINEDEFNNEVKYIKDKLRYGKSPTIKDFIYIPLQVDTPTSDGKPDFKFRFTEFKNNKEFLNFVSKIIPKNIKVLVKNHPSCKRPTKVPSNMIDITNAGYSKYELYKKMKAMMVINSTSILEAMLFNKPIFTYGNDIFSGKNITYEFVKNVNEFKFKLEYPVNVKLQNKFISTLLQRQYRRYKCNNKNYIQEHYWNKKLRDN